jgi:hypothetical protein
MEIASMSSKGMLLQGMEPEEVRFKRNTQALCATIQNCQEELRQAGKDNIPALQLSLAVAFIDACNDTALIQAFIKHSYKGDGETWAKVKEKSVEYFISNADVLFGALPISSGNILKDVFESDVVHHTRVGDIWKCLTNMVKICIKYVIRERKTDPNFMPQVDVESQKKLWEMPA